MTAPARIVAALIPLVIAAGPAFAGSDQDEAKALFEQGQEHYSNKLYAKALVSFLDSYDLNPEPEVLYNIALCYEKIDQDGKAVEYYEKYLATVEDEKERARILARIESVEAGQDPDAVEDDPGYAEDEDMGRPDDDEVWPKKKKKDGDGGGEPKESKKEKIKKKFTGEYKGDWMHGLHVAAAVDLDVRVPKYIDGGDTGVGVKFGYMPRILDQRLMLDIEIGYLTVGYWDEHRWAICSRFGALYRVGLWLGGTIQLYLGGSIDTRWRKLQTARHGGYGMIGLGADARLLWHWSQHSGLFIDIAPHVEFVPSWSGIPVDGVIMFQLGLLFGIK